MICDVVVDCFGRELVVIYAYSDGSYNCPSCHYAVRPEEPHCQNPCCYTRPGFPVETAIRWEQERAQRKAEDERRRRDHEAAMQRHRDNRAREQERDREIVAAARASGACVRCALESVKYSRPLKFTKHRKKCPRE